jgi:hypothetical protein
MASHSTLSPLEAADRLAIRELFDAYARCADTRDAEGQKALFTEDTRFAVYMDGPGRAELRARRSGRAVASVRRLEPLRGDDALQRPEAPSSWMGTRRPETATRLLITSSPQTGRA